MMFSRFQRPPKTPNKRHLLPLIIICKVAIGRDQRSGWLCVLWWLCGPGA